MKNMFLHKCFFGIVLMLFVSSYSGNPNLPYLVVVNLESDFDQINRWELSAIFLGKKTLWEEETKIYPCLLREDNRIIKQFIREIHSKSLVQYRAYWKKRLFSGAGIIPKSFRRSKSVINYVAQTPGAIGIIPFQKLPKNVKGVKILW